VTREEAGRRIDTFLHDELVDACLTVMKERAYQMFLAATTDGDRVMAQARAKVLDDFTASLRGVVDDGELAKHDREQRERALGTSQNRE
jgi:hypothetical protein